MHYLLTLLMIGGLLIHAPYALVAEEKPINTICPVTGEMVNSAIAPVIVTVGKGERSEKIIIGVADAASATKVKNNPTAYVAAAKANKQAK